MRYVIRLLLLLNVYYWTANLTTGWALEMLTWQDVSDGIPDSEILSVGVSPWDSQEIYIGTSNAIYRTFNHGKHWQRILRVKGWDTHVYCIAFAGPSSSVIYAATGNGVYRSLDHGIRWQQVLRAGKMGQRSVYWVEPSRESQEVAYAAAVGGLFWTQDMGRTWQKLHTFPADTPIRRVIKHPRQSALWIVADPGIFYSSDHGKSWERIWVSPSDLSEEEQTQDSEGGSTEQFFSSQKVAHIVLQPLEGGTFRLIAGTSMGLLAQSLPDASWEILPRFGMTVNEIHFVTINPKNPQEMFIGTEEGVFYWDGKEEFWQSLSDGMLGHRIHELEFSLSGRELWAATDRGIYYTQIHSNWASLGEAKQGPNFLTAMDLVSRYRHEATIEEVQEKAIEYGEVHPEKIIRWRRAAQTKAFLPQVSLDINRQRDDNVDVAEEGTTTPDKYIVGPDEQTLEFNVSLTWDLSEVIWNEDQTSIDTRSRLMVQLRDDILEEVTRLYFERRRLQLEEELSPSKDLRQQVMKELKMEELTAQIDALTGGWFSRRLNQK